MKSLSGLACVGTLLASRDLFKSYFLSIHYIKEEFAYGKTYYNAWELEYLSKPFLKIETKLACNIRKTIFLNLG